MKTEVWKMSDNSFDEQLAVMRAAGDQAKAAVVDLAERLGAFRKQLIIEGFNQRRAEEMSQDLFATILGKDDDDDESEPETED